MANLNGVYELIPLIQNEIQNQGSISFADYMSLVLYHPSLGYYSGPKPKFGYPGDFITAPELSPLFSGCIANFCRQILESLGKGSILELGAGSGIMAFALLTELQKQGTLPDEYLIYELSPSLKKRQQEHLACLDPELSARVRWIDDIKAVAFEGVILGNEFLDALPVHCFNISRSQIFERRVIETVDQNQPKKFAFINAPCDSKEILDLYHHSGLFDLGDSTLYYDSEINLNIQSKIAELSQSLISGVILLIDYGFSRSEYYHGDRNMGTLMCHYQHQAHADPFVHLGQQDITAHVDFTAVAMAADESELEVIGYTNQASFLIETGLLDLKMNTVDTMNTVNLTHNEIKKYSQSQAIHIFTSPAEMGELFKVMGLSKNFDLPIRGFSFQDRRYSL
jgi:SAM-dependent MidA family methyltransferase